MHEKYARFSNLMCEITHRAALTLSLLIPFLLMPVRLAIVWTSVVHDQSCFTEQTTASRGWFSTTGGQYRSEVVGLLSIGIRIEPSVGD